jgi:hypothetical protein
MTKDMYVSIADMQQHYIISVLMPTAFSSPTMPTNLKMADIPFPITILS